jgi:hypothetical protein
LAEADEGKTQDVKAQDARTAPWRPEAENEFGANSNWPNRGILIPLATLKNMARIGRIREIIALASHPR